MPDEMTPDEPEDELDKLRQDYPGWQIGTAYIQAASGPGCATYWAKHGTHWTRHGTTLLVAFSVQQLRLDLQYAESHRELAREPR